MVKSNYKYLDAAPPDLTYECKNIFVRFYFKKIVDISVKISGVQKSHTVLDFGCGYGYLKKRLGKNVIGYDIKRELSEISDYTKIKADVIFCLQTFEHVDMNELKDILNNFSKMNPQVIIITAQPVENIVHTLLSWSIGYTRITGECHKLTFVEVNSVLEQFLEKIQEINFFNLCRIAKWRFK